MTQEEYEKLKRRLDIGFAIFKWGCLAAFVGLSIWGILSS
jgi:hypothetical protein